MATATGAGGIATATREDQSSEKLMATPKRSKGKAKMQMSPKETEHKSVVNIYTQ